MKNTRIYKLREYLLEILKELISSDEFQLNANFLAENVGNYSLDKIPTESQVEKWIDGTTIYRDVYEFRSRESYGPTLIDNLSSVGFFETFEKTIEEKNNNKDLPQIDGIEEIKCLNCGALSSVDTPDTAEFGVQIQITYRKEV